MDIILGRVKARLDEKTRDFDFQKREALNGEWPGEDTRRKTDIEKLHTKHGLQSQPTSLGRRANHRGSTELITLSFVSFNTDLAFKKPKRVGTSNPAKAIQHGI